MIIFTAKRLWKVPNSTYSAVKMPAGNHVEGQITKLISNENGLHTMQLLHNNSY